MDFSSLSKNELRVLLKKLTVLRSLSKIIGKRATKTVFYGGNTAKDVRLEYPPNTDTEETERFLRGHLSGIFTADATVTKKENPKLKGGVRVFA